MDAMSLSGLADFTKIISTIVSDMVPPDTLISDVLFGHPVGLVGQ